MKLKMNSEEVAKFLIRHSFSNERIANILGITKPAVDHWLTGRRDVPPTAVKVMKLIDNYPHLAEVMESIS